MAKSELGLVHRPGSVTSYVTFFFCLLGNKSAAGHLPTVSVLMCFCISSGLVNAVCMSLSSQSAPCQEPSARSMLSSPSLSVASPETYQSHVPRSHAAQQLASGLLILTTTLLADTLDAMHAAQQLASGLLILTTTWPADTLYATHAAQQSASGLLISTTTRPADTLAATHAGAKGDRVCCPR